MYGNIKQDGPTTSWEKIEPRRNMLCSLHAYNLRRFDRRRMRFHENQWTFMPSGCEASRLGYDHQQLPCHHQSVRIWLAKIKIWPLKMGRNRESHHHRIIGSFTIIDTLASVDTVPDFLWCSMQVIIELLKMGMRDISKDWKVEHVKPQKVGSNSGSRGNLLVWVRRISWPTHVFWCFFISCFCGCFSSFRWGNFQFLMAELCWTPFGA